MKFLKKIKIELTFLELLIYLRKIKTIIWKKMHMSMFIAALFIIGKTQKQPICPSIGEWIKTSHTHTHTNEILLSHKKELNLAICNNMNGPRGY